MKRITLVLVSTLVFLLSGCSDQSELKAARDRIAKLEAELAAAKASQPSLPASPTPDKVTSTTKPAVPETNFEPTGQQWTYDKSEDKMTGGATRHAFVLSTNTVNFSSPYSGEQHGRLSIRTDPKYGRDVIFSIERGQLLCRSYEDCDVLVRFDDAKPERFSAIGPADNSTETVFLRNYERFLGKLRKAKTVRISLNVYQQGAPVFEFDVSGFNEAKYSGKK
ncbi:MAG: hypothetical protein RL654_2277 [Pseudomonadota bacterium]